MLAVLDELQLTALVSTSPGYRPSAPLTTARERARTAVGTTNPEPTMSSPARLPSSPDEGCREETWLHAT